MYWKKRAILLLILITAILAACGPRTELVLEKLDSQPRIAVISAFKGELKSLLKQAEIADEYVVNGRTYYVGRLAGNDVVMFLSGVSMVNAAMTTQTALDNFEVTRIVVSGIAGGVNPELHIGDVIVPAQWAQYQEQMFARQTEEGWDTGMFKANHGNFDMMFPQPVGVTQKGDRPDAEDDIFWFLVDSEMLAITESAASKAALERCTGLNACLENDPIVAVGGNGVSGSTFVDNAAYRQWVWETFEANALDMETAAVAHVAHVNDVPYIAFRSLSDLAGGGPGENQIATFFQLASDNSAEVVITFLEAWANRGN